MLTTVKLCFYLLVGSWVLVAFASAADNSDDSLPTSTVVKQDNIELHLQDIVVDGARKKHTIRLGNLATYEELKEMNYLGLNYPETSRVYFMIKVQFGMRLEENVDKVLVKIPRRTFRKYRNLFPGPTEVVIISTDKNGEKKAVLTRRGVGKSKKKVKMSVTRSVSEMIYDSPNEFLNTTILVRLTSSEKLPQRKEYTTKQMTKLKRKMSDLIQLKYQPSIVIRTVNRVFRLPRSPQDDNQSHQSTEYSPQDDNQSHQSTEYSPQDDDQSHQSTEYSQETEEQQVETTSENSRSFPVPCKRPPVKTEEAFLSRVHREKNDSV